MLYLIVNDRYLIFQTYSFDRITQRGGGLFSKYGVEELYK